jgi:two-component system response regulator YesN
LSECYEEANHQLSLRYLAWRNADDTSPVTGNMAMVPDNDALYGECDDDRSNAMFKKVLDYIEERYTDENFSLNDAAKAANVSPNYFSAIFSQEMDMTFIEYVTKKRMDKAKKLLRQGKMSTADVATQVGYKDSHYFSFVFKKTQGCTPREYRNESKNG